MQGIAVEEAAIILPRYRTLVVQDTGETALGSCCCCRGYAALKPLHSFPPPGMPASLLHSGEVE